MIGTWMLPTLNSKTSEYYEDFVSVKCMCGRLYFGGSGSTDDPLMKAAYNPESGMLDECDYCA